MMVVSISFLFDMIWNRWSACCRDDISDLIYAQYGYPGVVIYKVVNATRLAELCGQIEEGQKDRLCHLSIHTLFTYFA